jgi:hypothetical protein
LFVLAPARSLSSVITAMIGQHPQLHSFPELSLFRAEYTDQLLVDPPGWLGSPSRNRVGGLLRALAQSHDGKQDEESIERALEWLMARKDWPVANVLDHLLDGVAPLVGVEKSPENSGRDTFLERMGTAYPRARYVHLVRHPVTTVRSMHGAWSTRGWWRVQPELFHQFCWSLWYYQHKRIADFGKTLPPDRFRRARAEDIANEPDVYLPELCRWLGVDASPDSVRSMKSPEKSAYAALGPSNARGGADLSFLGSPSLRPAELPNELSPPDDWILDPWSVLMVHRLATELGYGDATPVGGPPHMADQSEKAPMETVGTAKEPAAVP